MLKVIIDFHSEDSIVLPDGKSKEFVSDIISDYKKEKANKTIRIGNETIFNYFRLAVKKRTISFDEITFEFDGSKVSLMPNGKLDQSEVKIVSHFENTLYELLWSFIRITKE